MKDRQYRKETIANLRSLGDQEITKREKDLTEELFWLRFKNEGGQLDKPTELRRTKKMLARVKTILEEKQREQRKKSK